MERDEQVSEELTMVVSARDKDTAQPIADTRFNVTLFTGRRPKPYGAFTADKQGDAVVDLPPERIKLVSIQALANAYAPVTKTWNVIKGEKVPTNFVFQLLKENPQ